MAAEGDCRLPRRAVVRSMDARNGGSPLCRSERVCPSTLGRIALALALGWLLGRGAIAVAQTPPGTTISSRALVTYTGIAGRAATAYSNPLDIVTVPVRTRSSIALTRLVTGARTYFEPVGPSSCVANGIAAPLANPTVAGKTLDPDAAQPLLDASVLHGGDPIFVRVADADHNLDPAARESVDVTLSSASTGDRETIRLTETAAASGVFAGFAPSSAATAAPGDCVLEVARAGTLEAAYVDADDASDASSARAALDPVG